MGGDGLAADRRAVRRAPEHDSFAGRSAEPRHRLASHHSAEFALREVDALAADLDGYALFHAARAELLNASGQPEQARPALERALSLTANPAERGLLRRRIDG
ncbi:MAG: hypothetical protein M3069_16565 [Chloroflexota bacterium]|nr:hypothetical protein [Chloroflexota bacterium]